MATNYPLPLRVYSEPDGKIYLLNEPENLRIKVEEPIDEKSLQNSSLALEELRVMKRQKALLATEGESEEKATNQQRANRQIRAFVEPSQTGFVSRLGKSLLELFVVVYAMGIAVYPVYRIVRLSQEKLPEWLHVVVLLVCAGALAFSIYQIAAPERLDEKQRKIWFGKNGLLFLSTFNLAGAASVFAAITFWLYQKHWVILQPCPDAPPVTPGSLLDFYMVQLLKLVPFLNLKDTLKWGEPVCYTQARVGLLILVFQGLVVLPCINAIRYAWKNRKLTRPYEYIYEPGWKPESVLEP